MSTSIRDLLITGWLITLVTTVAVVLFHSDFQTEGSSQDLYLGGLAAIGAAAGILLVRFVNMLGASSSRYKKSALVLYTVCMVALIPVMKSTFAAPWAVLIILTLLYVRWKWALAKA